MMKPADQITLAAGARGTGQGQWCLEGIKVCVTVGLKSSLRCQNPLPPQLARWRFVIPLLFFSRPPPPLLALLLSLFIFGLMAY
jgi:hypothetical protein